VAQDASENGLGMTRRIFVAGLASVRTLSPALLLDAIAAERMPHQLLISGVPKSPFFEIRDYGTEYPEFLVAQGRALRLENGKLLLPFESLSSREELWRRLSVDPQWIASQKYASLNEIAIYRTL
jgi:hypothetical protein